ncbi:AAA family ATPase [Legionella dresdenensis]|uniref:AAA family ATPase n=1 Tax=Legionella dresdenensis TaxID=450200 RepID=A0ABV8CHG0_9GAMM
MIVEHHDMDATTDNAFETLIEKGQTFVDKSRFLRWIDGAGINILMCGEGWGKSTNLSMLRSFLSNHEPHQSELFKDLAISRQGAYGKFQGKYPVLWLDFSKLGYGSTEKEIKDDLVASVRNLYQNFELEPPKDLASNRLPREVQRLSVTLRERFGLQPILIIDDYDKPTRIAHYGGFYQAINSIIEGLLTACLKNTAYVCQAFLIGQTRPGDKQVPTNFNNFSLYSIFDRKFQGIFGFSQEEVKTLFTAHNQTLAEEDWQQLSLWYGGYYVAGKEYYNPRSITCYLNQLKLGNAEFKPFLSSESPFFKTLSPAIVTQLGSLLKNNAATIRLRTDVFSNYYPGSEASEAVMLNRLLYSQILTPTQATSDFDSGDFIEVKLPNQEITYFIKNLLVMHYQWNESCLSKKEVMTFIGQYLTENPKASMDAIIELGALVHQNKFIEASAMVNTLKANQTNNCSTQDKDDSVTLSPIRILTNNSLGSPIHSNRNSALMIEQKEQSFLPSMQ